ncbi:MAG: glutathione peroxidase [Nocardioidaceae bacterium]
MFDLSFTDNHGRTVDLADFAGRPVLVVNTASQCGFTPQYDGLQELHERFGEPALGDRGLVVLGFPCDQFGGQEPGGDDEIAEFCRVNHGVTFPLSTKVEVNGAGTHPVFAFLKDRAGGLLGSGIKWNFTKFLVSADGRSVRRYAPTVPPAKIAADVAELVEA